jgi:hypothetical protein
MVSGATLEIDKLGILARVGAIERTGLPMTPHGEESDQMSRRQGPVADRTRCPARDRAPVRPSTIERFSMLIHFQTKAFATITMFGDVAITLIKLMGHSGAVPGALLADDVPAALERLKAAVAEHPNDPLDPAASEVNRGDESQRVSLAHRALPLIELLTAAARDGENVMWES